MSNRMRHWRRRAQAFGRAGLRGQAMTIEAIALLTLARVAVRTLPFQRIAEHPVLRLRKVDTSARTTDVAAIARIVGAAARAMPFRAKCLEQAITTTAMLRGRGVAATLHLGTRRGTGDAGLEAHAWVSIDGEVIIGGPVYSYTEVIRY